MPGDLCFTPPSSLTPSNPSMHVCSSSEGGVLVETEVLTLSTLSSKAFQPQFHSDATLPGGPVTQAP